MKEKTSCSDVLERLPLYVGADLDEDSSAFVRAHLDHCEGCAREAAVAGRAREVFRTSLRSAGDRTGSDSRSGAGPTSRPNSRGATSPNLWDGVRATLLREGLIHSGSPGESVTGASPFELPRVAASRARRPGRLLRMGAAAAAAAAVVAIVARFGAGLLGAGAEPGPDPSSFANASPDSGGAPLLAGVQTPISVDPLERRLQRVEPGSTSLLEEAQPLPRRVFVPTGEGNGSGELASFRGSGPVWR